MSVATWSLRERPVCRRLPASPTSSVRRRSMLRCTSSSSIDQGKPPARISADLRHAALDILQILLRQHADRACSMRACASEPWMSNSASRRSNSTEAV
jgi:hypothetical protein